MPLQHGVSIPTTLESEVAILRHKFTELMDGAAQYRATLGKTMMRAAITWDIFAQCTQNVKEIEEDANDIVAKSILSGDILQIRFAMGMLEGYIEWLTKPILPLA